MHVAIGQKALNEQPSSASKNSNTPCTAQTVSVTHNHRVNFEALDAYCAVHSEVLFSDALIACRLSI